MHKLVIEGFTPNANTPDANFGACLQCAVFDRARLKATPVFPRSDVCSKCFEQYCYDPNHPPSRDELPNRKQAFKDPDPVGLTSFVSRNKSGLIGGLVGLVVFIGALVGGLQVFLIILLGKILTFLHRIWWKKRSKKAYYKRLSKTYQDEAFDIPIYSTQHSQLGSQTYDLPNQRGGL